MGPDLIVVRSVSFQNSAQVRFADHDEGVCGELPILPEPSIRRSRFHPVVGPYPSRLRAVFAIRILEIGAAGRVFRAPALEGSGTGLIQSQPRGAGRELIERRCGSVREAPLAAIAVLVFAVRTAEG